LPGRTHLKLALYYVKERNNTQINHMILYQS